MYYLAVILAWQLSRTHFRLPSPLNGKIVLTTTVLRLHVQLCKVNTVTRSRYLRYFYFLSILFIFFFQNPNKFYTRTGYSIRVSGEIKKKKKKFRDHT